MTLLVDSGGTKAEWCIAETGFSVTSCGLNPSLHDLNTLIEGCRAVAPHFSGVDRIFFYGCGCGSDVARERMLRALGVCFPTASVVVETDMLGACRALAGDAEAIIGILGTGSNACFYDGANIVANVPSMGYVVGDYGSANHIGRQLLLDYFSQRMPQVVASQFSLSFDVEHSHVIENVYHSPHPNRYLAAFAPFAVEHVDHAYCRTLLNSSLDLWFDTQLRQLCSSGSLLHLNGGFAYALRPLLPSFCARHDLQLGRVEKSPMSGLVRYHLGK